MLRNNLGSGPMAITPTLRLSDGSELTLPPVSVASGDVQSLNLHEALMQSHPEIMGVASPYGSVALRYTSVSNGNLYASAMIHDDGHPILFHLDGSQAGVGSGSGSHEGVWWLPKSTTKGYFVLANMSSAEQNGVLWLYDQAGHSFNQTVSLPAKQTQRVDLRELVSRSGLSGSVGGVSFKMGHDVNTVVSTLILFDEPSGFSANMKTFIDDHSVTLPSHDFAGVGKWITRAPMLALETPDPALQLPAQTTLHPQIFLRNTTNRAVEARVSFHWRNATTDGRAQLPATKLAALETRILDVKVLQDKGTIPADANWAQVTLATDTLPDEVMAVAASFDETLRYGAQTPFSDQLAFHMEGAAWQVDQNHDSIIAVGNGGAKPVQTRLTFFYANGTKQYQLDREIAPDDQAWIDIGTLIRSQAPDKDGNVLPYTLTTGAYQIRDLAETPSPSLYEGKVVTDKTYGHATYGCTVCCGYRAVVLSPDAIDVGVGGLAGLEAVGVDSCGSPTQWIDLDGFVTSWTSANSAVMSVSPALARGMSVGQTTAYATLNVIEGGPPRDSGGRPCPMQNVVAQAPATVGCFAQLKYRNAVGGLATHAFWYIQDSTGLQSIIDGGPSVPATCPVFCGFLVDWISSTPVPPVSSRYPTDNVNAGTWFSSGPPATGVCTQVDQLLFFANAWVPNVITYNPLGPNSNTFAQEAGASANWYPGAPPGAVGW